MVSQVAALTTHIENGFQQMFKSGTVFLDLTAAVTPFGTLPYL